MKLTRYEIVGVLGSVGIMALVLGYLHKAPTDVAERTVITASSTVNISDVAAVSPLEKTLLDAHRPDGTLAKLVVEDMQLGTIGDPVAAGDTVTIHYIGATTDGVRFTNSYERNQPYTFTLGTGKMVSGLEEGIVGMRVGGQRVLVVPPEMAYGNNQVGIIPPNAALLFSIELLEIK